MRLKLLRLKGEIMLPGVGLTLKTTVQTKDHPGMELETRNGFVSGTFKGVTFGIPNENIIVFIASEEQT